MPSLSADSLDQQASLLVEAVHLLVNELVALTQQAWVDVPELKKRKVVLAAKLRRLEAQLNGTIPPRSVMVDSLVGRLDELTQRKIGARRELISRQILALQELDLYWRECQNVSFRMFVKRPLGNGVSIV